MDNQAVWARLIELNGALLNEVSLHQRRILLLQAVADLTNQAGHVWLVTDGRAALADTPALLQKAAQTNLN